MPKFKCVHTYIWQLKEYKDSQNKMIVQDLATVRFSNRFEICMWNSVLSWEFLRGNRDQFIIYIDILKCDGQSAWKDRDSGLHSQGRSLWVWGKPNEMCNEKVSLYEHYFTLCNISLTLNGTVSSGISRHGIPSVIEQAIHLQNWDFFFLNKCWGVPLFEHINPTPCWV